MEGDVHDESLWSGNLVLDLGWIPVRMVPAIKSKDVRFRAAHVGFRPGCPGARSDGDGAAGPFRYEKAPTHESTPRWSVLGTADQDIRVTFEEYPQVKGDRSHSRPKAFSRHRTTSRPSELSSIAAWMASYPFIAGMRSNGPIFLAPGSVEKSTQLSRRPQ